MTATPPSPLQFLIIPPKVRPVDPHWRCQKSGDCCSLPDEVIMTRQERDAILPKVPQGIRTAWRDIEGSPFVALKAKPCPFFIFGDCQIYDVRPYNCRRFACLRPDPKAEPFEMMPQQDGRYPTGNVNADDRFMLSRIARRMLIQIQRKAARYGLQHGWS